MSPVILPGANIRNNDWSRLIHLNFCPTGCAEHRAILRRTETAATGSAAQTNQQPFWITTTRGRKRVSWVRAIVIEIAALLAKRMERLLPWIAVLPPRPRMPHHLLDRFSVFFCARAEKCCAPHAECRSAHNSFSDTSVATRYIARALTSESRKMLARWGRREHAESFDPAVIQLPFAWCVVLRRDFATSGARVLSATATKRRTDSERFGRSSC
jgi:hypothetical protein